MDTTSRDELSPNMGTWYGRGTLVALGGILLIALYGFYTSWQLPQILGFSTPQPPPTADFLLAVVATI
jgi:hypothetical protein